MYQKIYLKKFILTIFFIFGFFLIDLNARLNPFNHEVTPVNIPITNNSIKTPEDFQKAIFSLPRSARVLETIEVTYQNVDGSVETKRIILNKKVNWTKDLAFQYDKACHSAPKPVYKVAKKETPKPTQNKRIVKRTTKTVKTTTTTRRVSEPLKYTEKAKLPNRGIDKGETIEIEKEKNSKREEVQNRVSVVHYVDPTDEIYFDKIPQKMDTPPEEKPENKNYSYDPNKGFYVNNSKPLETRLNGESSASNTPNQKQPDNSNFSFNTGTSSGLSPATMPLDYPEYHKTNKPDPTSITSTIKSDDFKVIATLGDPEFVKFETKDNIVKIHTKDRQARHFMLNRPYRIVIDFKRNVAFNTQTFPINSEIYESLKVGKHNDFYRVVLTLKDNYKYKLKRLSGGGYEIECNK